MYFFNGMTFSLFYFETARNEFLMIAGIYFLVQEFTSSVFFNISVLKFETDNCKSLLLQLKQAVGWLVVLGLTTL